jgi:hypothetical protein
MGLLTASAAPLASGVLAALAVAFAPGLASSLVRLARGRWRRCLVFGGSAVVAGSMAAALFFRVGLWSLTGLIAGASVAAASVAVAATGTLIKVDFAEKPYVCVAAGFAALTVASIIPLLGAAVQLAALSWGAGAVILHLRKESA